MFLVQLLSSQDVLTTLPFVCLMQISLSHKCTAFSQTCSSFEVLMP